MSDCRQSNSAVTMTSTTLFGIYMAMTASLVVSTPVREERFLLDSMPPLTITQNTYKAGVLNHQTAYYRGPTTTRAQALEAMSQNLDIYEKHATVALKEKVDIVVFPEDGIYGSRFTRQSIKPFLETIPDPKKAKWNPCLEPTLYNSTEIQQRLSCMARNHSLYIVANMGDKQPCTVHSSSCPSDRQYQYNTDVVFDPNGYLIARYHKRNLYFESQFDHPPVELVTFDTPFGRFAVFTCFDSLFRDPAIAVIEKYNVDSVAFPTLWVESPPFLSGFQWQAAFSAGMKVNLLAANHARAGGSGIYTPSGPAVYVTNYEPAELLVATISSRHLDNEDQLTPPNFKGVSSDKNTFHANMFHDQYNFVALSGRNGTATVCSGTFCCQAEFSRKELPGEIFALGVFSGVHTATVRTGLQVCALMKCADSSTNSCGYPTLFSNTLFTHLELKGNFDTRYVFPEVLLANSGKLLLPATEWFYSNTVIKSNTGFTHPLHSAILFGRLTNKDF